jgi:hypothetical protein
MREFPALVSIRKLRRALRVLKRKEDSCTRETSCALTEQWRKLEVQAISMDDRLPINQQGFYNFPDGRIPLGAMNRRDYWATGQGPGYSNSQ